MQSSFDYYYYYYYSKSSYPSHTKIPDTWTDPQSYRSFAIRSGLRWIPRGRFSLQTAATRVYDRSTPEAMWPLSLYDQSSSANNNAVLLPCECLYVFLSSSSSSLFNYFYHQNQNRSTVLSRLRVHRVRRVSATGRRSRRCSRTRSASRWTRAATFTSQTIEITEYAKYMVVIIFYTFPDDCTEYILSAFISFLLPIMPLLSTKRVQLIRLVVTASAQQRSSATQVRVDDGTVITLAGTGEPGFADGPAASAKFNNPWGAVPRDSPLQWSY